MQSFYKCHSDNKLSEIKDAWHVNYWDANNDDDLPYLVCKTWKRRNNDAEYYVIEM